MRTFAINSSPLQYGLPKYTLMEEQTISAVIITFNEERNITRCLNSLQGVADEVLVVDSGSTDATESLCQAAGTRFIHHEWEGYAEQKNFANSLATGHWILSLDADEALSPQLRESLLHLKRQGMQPDTIYAFPRLTNYCGRWIKHCGWYPDLCTRLWRNDGTIQWSGLIHEQLQYTHTPHPRQVLLQGDLLHYSYYTVADHLSRMVKYAPLSAQKAWQEGKRCGVASIVWRPLWTFLRGYIFKGGFLDGSAGFIVCRLSATYTLVKYATLYHLSHASAD